MNDRTVAEIVVVTAAAAFLAFLWHGSRAGGMTTAPGLVPSASATAPLPGATIFDIPGAVAGVNPVLNTEAPCNCSGSSSPVTFGSQGDLITWLQHQTPGLFETVLAGVNDYY